MKILVICQYYYPEPFKIHDICEELVKCGHEVDVVTGTPNYPMGETYSGYEKEAKKDEIINGVNIHRCKIVERKHDPIHRFLNYLSYPKQANKYLKKIDKKYDVIFVYQLSPVLMAKPAINYKKKHGTKIVLYSLDIWPESLKTGGISEKSIIFKYFKKESRDIYQSCDKILVTSKCFIKYLAEEFDIERNKFDYLPQYAEAQYDRKECQKKPSSKINLMFAGNIGKAQNLGIIINAAEKLKNNKNLQFHIVGDGSEYENIKRGTRERKINNVIFYGRKPAEEMPVYYKMADAMLITLKSGSAISETLPGKMQTYMAAGKPVIGSIDGDANEVIKKSKCGYCCDAEDEDGFIQQIENFINCKDKEQLAKNSYNYYKENFTKENYIKTLNNELEKARS